MRTLTPSTQFHGIDLVVRSRRSLAPLLKIWSWAQTPGRMGTEAPRCLLVITRRTHRTADGIIQEFVRMVDALPPLAKRSWRDASSRTFDIGIQAGLSPWSFEEVRVQPKTIQEVSRVGASILLTIYAPVEEEEG